MSPRLPERCPYIPDRSVGAFSWLDAPTNGRYNTHIAAITQRPGPRAVGGENEMTIDYTTNKLGDVRASDGTIVHLTQQAYSVNWGTDGGVVYRAHGKDDEGNEYMVTWQTYDNADEIENEDEMCDWDKYEVEAI